MGAIFHDGHFAGSVSASRHVNGLTLAETHYAPRSHVAAHAHDHAICCLVLDGGFTERAGRKDRVLEAGSLLFHPADEAHAHVFHHSGGRCFNIQFGGEWTHRMQNMDVRWPAEPVDLHNGRARWIAEQLRPELSGSDQAAELIIEGYALALLGEVVRFTDPPVRERTMPGWLRRAVELLHSRQDQPLNLGEIAAIVDVHPTHLARTFRAQLGCTVGEYLRALRIESACRQLLETDHPLAAVALDAGFADQAHFSRVFKRATGMSPGEFRKNRIGR